MEQEGAQGALPPPAELLATNGILWEESLDSTIPVITQKAPVKLSESQQNDMNVGKVPDGRRWGKQRGKETKIRAAESSKNGQCTCMLLSNKN